jgi:Tat protein translocase TatB subunit
MFEVGFTELLLIFALALVVLGPEKLPRVANQVGRWMGRARAMARQFREQLESEAVLEDTPPHKPAAAAPDTPPPASSTPDSSTPDSSTPDSSTPDCSTPNSTPVAGSPLSEKYYQPDDDVARADVSHADAGAEPDVKPRADDERGT